MLALIWLCAPIGYGPKRAQEFRMRRCVSMRFLRLLISACLLLLGVNAAFADGTPPDPKITMGGSGSCQSFDETSLVQEFDNLDTGCMVDFTNEITFQGVPVSIFTLIATVDTSFGGVLTCALAEGAPLDVVSQPSANSCRFSSSGDANIGGGVVYSLEFDNDPSGPGAFATPLDVTLSANPAPEPSTLLFASLGMALLVVAKKKL